MKPQFRLVDLFFATAIAALAINGCRLECRHERQQRQLEIARQLTLDLYGTQQRDLEALQRQGLSTWRFQGRDGSCTYPAMPPRVENR